MNVDFQHGFTRCSVFTGMCSFVEKFAPVEHFQGTKFLTIILSFSISKEVSHQLQNAVFIDLAK